MSGIRVCRAVGPAHFTVFKFAALFHRRFVLRRRDMLRWPGGNALLPMYVLHRQVYIVHVIALVYGVITCDNSCRLVAG